MIPQDSFAQLMTRLKEGDQTAAGEVFGRFIRRLVALATNQFDSWIHTVALRCEAGRSIQGNCGNSGGSSAPM